MSRVQRPPVVDFSDLTAVWPTMSPSARRHAMRARMLGTDRGLYPGPWDFVRHLRNQPSFDETWLENLSILDGDLAIGNQCIFKLPLEDVGRCEKIAVERQIAAYWLQGDAPIYSRSDPSTLLSSC